jgi:hypothetical protein
MIAKGPAIKRLDALYTQRATEKVNCLFTNTLTQHTRCSDWLTLSISITRTHEAKAPPRSFALCQTRAIRQNKPSSCQYANQGRNHRTHTHTAAGAHWMCVTTTSTVCLTGKGTRRQLPLSNPARSALAHRNKREAAERKQVQIKCKSTHMHFNMCLCLSAAELALSAGYYDGAI